MNTLELCAMWHESQAKIMEQLARDAHAPQNADYCREQAGTHRRWAKQIRLAVRFSSTNTTKSA